MLNLKKSKRKKQKRRKRNRVRKWEDKKAEENQK